MKEINQHKYDWVSDGAKITPLENKELPWSVQFKRHNGGYGKSYHKTLNDALSFIALAEIHGDHPF